MSDTPIEDELRALRELKIDYDSKKESAEEAEVKFKTAQAAVFRRMEDNNIGSTTVDGVRFTPTSTTYHTMQDRESFVAWAEENEPELIEHRERKALLNALVRESLDNNQAFPPGLGSYDREYISQTA